MKQGGFRALLPVAVAAAGLLALVTPAALADGSALTVELVPASVATENGQPSHVLLIVRNSGSDASAVTVTWLDPSPAAIKLATDKLKPTALEKGAEHAWAFTVTTPVGAAASKVFFRVDYTADKEPHIATATLDVANASPTTADDVAGVEAKTTLESLDQQHPGVVYLLVTNKLPVPLTVDSVTAAGPDYVKFTTPAKSVRIPARQQGTIRLGVTAKDRVRTGKYLLLFATHLTWTAGKRVQTARVVTTQQAEIGIVGESAVLTLLGVPSFLLIPGFLIVLAIATLWKFRKPVGAGDFPVEIGKPDFWVIAVTLSIAVAFIYPHVGGVDYLSGAYGLRDIVWIWVASLVVGFLVYLGIATWSNARHRRLTPTKNDSPASVVAKIARQGLHLDLPRYVFGQGDAAYTGYLIEPLQEGVTSAWLAPLIQVTVKENATDGAALLANLQAENDPKKLAAKLKQRSHDLKIEWEAGAGPSHPYNKTAADLTAAQEGGPERFVRSN